VGYNLRQTSGPVTLMTKTTKERDQQDFQDYVEAWRERLAQQAGQQRMRAQHLQQIAQACARLLIQDFGARKVYLFGSLLDGELVHDRTDIDLAVERAWPALSERVTAEGKVLDVAA